jgi:peptidyl-prolyl cis-trans isomerase SurA
MKRLVVCLALGLLAAPALSQQTPRPAAPPPAAPPSPAPAANGVAVIQVPGAPSATPTPPPPNTFNTVITRATGQPLEGTAVMVNGEVISFSDVRNRMAFILMGLGVQPDEELIAQAQERATDQLINEKIQIQEYNKLLKDRPIEQAEIDERIEQVARQNNMTTDQFIRDFQTRGINVSTLRHRLQAEIGWQRIIGGRFGRNIRISPLQVDDRLAQLRAAADKPQYRLMEIFIYAPDAPSKERAMTLAGQLTQQIQRNVPFAQVAQQFSYAPSASAGGDLDWVSEADIRPEIAAVLPNARPGTLLPPITTEEGVYLMAFVGKREAASAGDSTLNLRQVVGRGDDAVTKLQAVKAAARNCAAVPAAAAAQGLQSVPLDEVSLSQMPEQYRAPLANLQPGQSTDVLPGNGGTQMVLFVCERQTGGALPSRDDVENNLFGIQVEMLADRYLRDLKREATIDRPRRG